MTTTYRKSLENSYWPERGPCDKCGRSGRYVGGYVQDEDAEVLNFLCADCDEMGEEICEALLATKH